jgi:hypothetical protein
MRLELAPETRVLIDLRATGLLRAVGHDPTLSARPEPQPIDIGEGSTVVASINVRFRADTIEPPEDIPASDRKKMRENMCSPEVLDASRFPTIDFLGRYVGTREQGTLSGGLWIRGASRPVSMGMDVLWGEGPIFARGTWEGRLTDLGIKPFRALLGTLKLEDWIRLRLQASLFCAPVIENAR